MDNCFGKLYPVLPCGVRRSYSNCNVTLAAANNVVGVTLGAILGHTICALIAVLGGSLIAGKVSERAVTMTGGVLFLVFAVVAILEGA